MSSSTIPSTMKRNDPSPPTAAMPPMKKVKLELGRAAAFVERDISNTSLGFGGKPRTTTPPSRGLRHFSMKVCEKVEEKGTTTYNEVADELVSEIKAADEKAARERGEPAPVRPADKKNNDDKNIRRRVYDALNVLMAMDIITKDKKEITWRGLPGDQDFQDIGLGSMNMISGLSRSQRMQKLEEERSLREEEVKKKKACLEELLVQNVCFQNLLGRNHGMEMQERQTRDVAARPKLEKIPLPLIVVNTNSRAVVQCEMTPDRTNVNFDFSLPFEINDDNQILKRLGMNYTSREALQRSLPRELYQYCNDNGIIDSVAQR
mmetsp:Transcript_10263/g.17463  ORF Transcript_10263/g.17463 Transcript_10263/m.17463 type:complete len:320 (-) Transcript_10263:47-1006(-)